MVNFAGPSKSKDDGVVILERVYVHLLADYAMNARDNWEARETVALLMVRVRRGE